MANIQQLHDNARYYVNFQERSKDDLNPLSEIKDLASKIEAFMSDLSYPLKPYMPAVGRFLIVVTFLEDAFTIITEWDNQLVFLSYYRGIYHGAAILILLTNAIAMVTCSFLVLAQRYVDYATGGLIWVVITQALCYGLISDFNYFLRNLSVLGGLLLVFADARTRKASSGPGIPMIEEKDHKMYIQLASRVLMILTFFGFFASLEWSVFSFVISILGSALCAMVAIGYKAKTSAIVLVSLLSLLNLVLNDFWNLHSNHPRKTFARYDFLQTLSVAGGLILLVKSGPGKYSIDEKKKAL
ncbi:hypothetical protein BP5796_09302 [Coleophoma crateriformis]|uniref:SURF4-domain-containing protein n=1 Tax=Coleophoma crateriformis TaxID=565419 RepID=A0A3D8R3M1_9HELO|nr:hypothetical protein BP5796_09302 [Coleophoma crateriformis]